VGRVLVVGRVLACSGPMRSRRASWRRNIGRGTRALDERNHPARTLVPPVGTPRRRSPPCTRPPSSSP
jgi:hypothetical protein